MKILLVYPKYPDTFWSFKHALKLIRKKASFPPLGLLTVAAMLPEDWEKKLVDLNVRPLTDEQIKWADYVFISAMVVQKNSAKEVISRCNRLGARVVAGGPLFTTDWEEFPNIDHLVLGEGEQTLPELVTDLKKGTPKRQYKAEGFPDISRTPVPLWSLIRMKDYTSMNIQYSRGCPFDCEFCDIAVLNGRLPRTKTKSQILAELDAIERTGWRDPVFIVDDNFIGNRKKLKQEILPAIVDWQNKNHHPFTLFTETSINLADDIELMDLMVGAGFNAVFVGIESPSEESLEECHKLQNTDRDLIESVKTIQNHGMQVMGGFIIGFDSDQTSIFKTQINFIQKSGIVTAMVGLLNAPRGTRLYSRLKAEKRLATTFTGDNMDYSLNFTPKMDRDTLIRGYQNVLNTIYSPKHFYDRARTFLKEYRLPHGNLAGKLQFYKIFGGINITWTLGFKEKGRFQYWKFLFSSFFINPRTVPISIELAAYGYHFRKVTQQYFKGA